MAACDLSQLITDSACYDTLSNRKLRELLAFSLLVSGTVVNPSGPDAVLEIPPLVSCWVNQSHHDLLAFQVISARNAYVALTTAEFPYTRDESIAEMACLSGMDDHQLDAAITALYCNLLSNLPEEA